MTDRLKNMLHEFAGTDLLCDTYNEMVGCDVGDCSECPLRNEATFVWELMGNVVNGSTIAVPKNTVKQLVGCHKSCHVVN